MKHWQKTKNLGRYYWIQKTWKSWLRFNQQEVSSTLKTLGLVLLDFLCVLICSLIMKLRKNIKITGIFS